MQENSRKRLLVRDFSGLAENATTNHRQECKETKRARVTVATAMETATKASDGDEGNGDNGGG